jgi:hypothetical protein
MPVDNNHKSMLFKVCLGVGSWIIIGLIIWYVNK